MKITAREAGWKYSDYNLFAHVPDSDLTAWVNTFSGGCSGFSEQEYQLIGKILEYPEDHEYIQHYAKRGLITNVDEKEVLRRKIEMDSSREDVLSLTICPTLACNFNCPYCFENHYSGMMGQEVMDAIVAFTRRMLSRHPFRRLKILWFGGEPLLGLKNIDSLSERLIEIADEYQVKYHAEIVTNGYLLNKTAVDVLAKGRVSKCQITLDGLAAAHNKTRCLTNGQGTFDTIIHHLRSQIPFRIEIRHNIVHENQGEAEPLEKFIEELAKESGNTISFYASPVFESDAAKERNSFVSLLKGEELSSLVYEDAMDTFSRKSFCMCQAGRRYYVSLDPEGKIYACPQAIGNPTEVTASIFDYDPDHGAQTALNPELHAYYSGTDNIFDLCGSCKFLPRCKGGCPYKRKKDGLQCPEYKDNPDSYVLCIYRHLQEIHEKQLSKTQPESKGSGSPV